MPGTRCQPQLLRRLPAHMPRDDHHVLVIEDGDVEAERLNALRHGIDGAIVDTRILVPRLEFVDQDLSDFHESPSPNDVGLP